MKKSLLLLAISLSICTAFAQITIKRSDIGVIGDKVYLATDSTIAPTVTPGSAGANQTWDFTTGIIPDAYDSAMFMAPSSDPQAPVICNIINRKSTTKDYLYIDSIVGKYIFSNAIIGVLSIKSYEFPFTYMHTFSDSVKGSAVGPPSAFGFPSIVDSVWIVFNVKVISTTDGWGTLKTPTGTYQTLRTKVAQDSRYIVKVKQLLTTGNVWTDFLDQPDKSITYNWMGQNSKYTLASAEMDTATGNIHRFTYKINSIPLTSVSIPQNDETQSLNVYPNPTSDQCNLNVAAFDGNVTLLVYDYTGKKVIETNFLANQTHHVNTSLLPNGVYTFLLSSDKKLAMQKVIITH